MKCNVTVDGCTWKNVNIPYSIFVDFKTLYRFPNEDIKLEVVDEPLSKNDEMIIKRIKDNLINKMEW